MNQRKSINFNALTFNVNSTSFLQTNFCLNKTEIINE